MISIRVPLYGALLYVSITDSPRKARLDACNIFGPCELNVDVAESIASHTPSGIFGLFLNSGNLSWSVVAHEIFHVSVHMASWAGIPVDPGNHEAVAYLHGWISEEVHAVIEAHKQH